MLLAMLAVLASATPEASAVTQSSPAASAPAPAAAAAPAKPAKPQLICRSEPVTGSMFSRKVCRTKEQIEDQKAQDDQSIRETQRIAGPLNH